MKGKIEKALELISDLDKELDQLDKLVGESVAKLRDKVDELIKTERARYIKEMESKAELIKAEYRRRAEREADRIKKEGIKRTSSVIETFRRKRESIKELALKVLLGEENV